MSWSARSHAISIAYQFTDSPAPMLTPFFVLTRIIANPLSNVFQKKLAAFADPRFIILVTQILLTLVCLPILFFLLPLRLGAGFWLDMLICAALAVGGNTLIVAALQSADLSVLGPLNAYKSIVGMALAAVMLRELPTPLGIVGVLMILAGSFFVLEQVPDEKDRAKNGEGRSPPSPFFARLLYPLRNRGVRLRFAALVLSAAEAVFLKEAVLASSPLITFLFWCILGAPFAAVATIYALRARVRDEIACMEGKSSPWLSLALTTGLMQFSTLYTLEALQVGYSLALFQTSTLLSVLFGYRFFREQNILRRLFGAVVMIGGAVLIVAFGSRG